MAEKSLWQKECERKIPDYVRKIDIEEERRIYQHKQGEEIRSKIEELYKSLDDRIKNMWAGTLDETTNGEAKFLIETITSVKKLQQIL